MKKKYDPFFLHKSKCIHCGACTGVCFSSALFLDQESRELQYDPKKCVACGMCITACPLQLFDYKTEDYHVSTSNLP